MQQQFINAHSHRKPGNPGEFVCRNAYHKLSENTLRQISYPVSVGVHPWHADEFSKELLAKLHRMACLPLVIALGEAGLDKRKGPAADLQMECWKAQFALAQETGLPLIVHCVRAWEEMRPFVRSTQVPMMFHDFRGSPQTMESFSGKEGIYFSFGRSLLHSDRCRHTFIRVPDDRILMETDQADVGIQAVYRAAAELRESGLDKIQEQVKKNALAFFGEKALPFF